MHKNITINIDEDVYEKFTIALTLNKDEHDKVVEHFMKLYITKSFGNASQQYNPNVKPEKFTEEAISHNGKANRRIPTWAIKPEQYNHKIIRAYFQAEKTNGRVTLSALEELCSDKSHPEKYVPTFRSNYAQMKLDGPKSHGKVFEDDGEMVNIWCEVKDTLMRYKYYFC